MEGHQEVHYVESGCNNGYVFGRQLFTILLAESSYKIEYDGTCKTFILTSIYVVKMYNMYCHTHIAFSLKTKGLIHLVVTRVMSLYGLLRIHAPRTMQVEYLINNL